MIVDKKFRKNILSAKKQIAWLEKQQAKVYNKLVKEMGIKGKQPYDDILFDYVYNNYKNFEYSS